MREDAEPTPLTHGRYSCALCLVNTGKEVRATHSAKWFDPDTRRNVVSNFCADCKDIVKKICRPCRSILKSAGTRRVRAAPEIKLKSATAGRNKRGDMIEQFTFWKPNTESRRRLAQVQSVLEEYKGMGITVTLRQLYYRLVAQNIIKNRLREYKNLGELLSKARLAGLIDWNQIEDRVRQPVASQEWESIEDLVHSAISQFRLPRWMDQNEYVELWCEKDALSSVLEPICQENHVTLMVNRGYSSSSAMYESSRRISQNANRRKAFIIYLGDFDPSGEDMVRDIQDRMEVFRTDVNVSKLALTPEQIEQYDLPPNPAKMSDSRAAEFVGKHGEDSYEVDALPPDVLQMLVTNAIKRHLNKKKYAAVIEREKELKAKLAKAARKIK